jgi:hypothetical protein
VTDTGSGTAPIVDRGAYEVQDNTPPCLADLTRNGVVDGSDLGVLLGDWSGSASGDINGDGTTNGADLGLMLSAWGQCP